VPNSLVHMGVQGLGARVLSKRIDLKWVFLGCIIPDIPWIVRRAVVALVPGIDIYSVTLYAAVQATLLFCVLLSLIFSLFSERPRLVFGILAVNALLHLLLDAVEIKWGNGVHLLAPLSWQLVSFGWVWPDSVLIMALSLGGIVFGIWVLVHPTSTPIRVQFKPQTRAITAIVFLCIYAILPLALLNGPYSADVQSIATLKERERRVGSELRLDRRPYQQRADGDVVITLAGEPLRIVGNIRATSPQVSLIGEFVDLDAIRIHQLHEFHSPWRDLASYVGLGLICLVWVVALVRERGSRELGVWTPTRARER
jgi:hypothetical protein